MYYHSRLSALLSDASAEDEKKLEKMKKWKEWRDKLNSKYKKTRGKFNKVKGQGIPKQPKKVQEQLQITRVRISYIALLIVLCTPYIKLLLRGPTYFVRVYARNNSMNVNKCIFEVSAVSNVRSGVCVCVCVCVGGGGGGLFRKFLPPPPSVRKVLHYCCDSLKTQLLVRLVSLVQETNVGQEKGVIPCSHSV